ncbi:MAG TPA: hypothetical protein VK805_21080 [Candidatus Baltobacteraceae bacterium]|nr:hypothetical protein [Candidatus Baltobacteraceae bacterium]
MQENFPSVPDLPFLSLVFSDGDYYLPTWYAQKMIAPIATAFSLLSSLSRALSLWLSKDPVRDDLQSKIHHFSNLSTWAVIAVAIGVLLEMVEVFYDFIIWIRLTLRKRRERIVWKELSAVSPVGTMRAETGLHSDHPKWVKLCLRIGIILVAAGVIGEWRYGGKLEDAHNDMHEYDVRKLMEAAQEAGNARISADKASAAAAKAEDSAGKAQEKANAVEASAIRIGKVAERAEADAGQAQSKADAVSDRTNGLTQELAKDEQGLTALEAKRAELEASLKNLAVCTAPRVLPFWTKYDLGKTTTEVDSLKAFAEDKADIEFVPDPEARRAASSIARALRRAGWSNVTLTVKDGSYDGVGVRPLYPPLDEPSLGEARTRSRAAADAVLKFLHSFNWQADLWRSFDEKGQLIHDPKTFPTDVLRVRVGLYPPTMFVAPPAMKAFEDVEKERRRQEQEMKTKRDEEYLKGLTPQQIIEWKTRKEEYEKRVKVIREQEDSNPCQPLTAFFPSP